MSAVERSRLEVADIIEQFVECRGGTWDWDDFCSFPIEDPELDAIRVQCCSLPKRFPATDKGHYCNPNGIQVMRGFTLTLRGSQRASE
jgi:hypothetical protein